MNRSLASLIRRQYVPFTVHVPRLCLKCSEHHPFRGFSAQVWRNNSNSSELHQNEKSVFNSSDDQAQVESSSELLIENDVKSESTRKVSRLLRKQRRIDTGTFKTKSREYAIQESSHLISKDINTEDATHNINHKGPKEQGMKTMEQMSHKTLVEKVEILEDNSKESVQHNQPSNTEANQSWNGSSINQDEHNIIERERQESNSEDVEESEVIPQWKIRRKKLKERLEGGQWRPTKRLSPETLEGIRALYEAYPDRVDLPMLSKHFGISYEAMRRIIKSKSWKPTAEQMQDRQARWERRGARIWNKLSRQGLNPSKQWQILGVGKTQSDQKVPEWKQQEWWESNVKQFLREEENKRSD